MIPSISILSTKILTDSQRQSMEASSLVWIERDFITVQLLDFSIDKLYDYLLITSQNAVRSLLQHPRQAEIKQKPVFCVGIKTKNLLEQNGWRVLAWAHYAIDLAPIIIRDYPLSEISFFNGNFRSDVLPQALEIAKIPFDEFQVYETNLTSQQINTAVDAICFYSPSGVYSYLQKNKIVDEMCFCIGKTTATALEGITERWILADQPTVDATLDACVNYYK